MSVVRLDMVPVGLLLRTMQTISNSVSATQSEPFENEHESLDTPSDTVSDAWTQKFEGWSRIDLRDDGFSFQIRITG